MVTFGDHDEDAFFPTESATGHGDNVGIGAELVDESAVLVEEDLSVGQRNGQQGVALMLHLDTGHR